MLSFIPFYSLDSSPQNLSSDLRKTWSTVISVLVFIGVLVCALLTYYCKTKRANQLSQMRWEMNVLYESRSSELNKKHNLSIISIQQILANAQP